MPWAHLERLTAHPQLFLSAADQIGSGVALVAREDLTYLVVNEALGRIDGVAVEDHVGRAVPDVLPPSQWRWLEPLSRRVFAGEEVTTRYTDTIDGGLRVADVRLSPVREDGEVAAMLVVVTDVSVGETVRRHSDQLLVLALELNLAESLGEVAEAVAAHSRHCFGAVDTGVYWRYDPQGLVRLSRETSGTVTTPVMERVGLEERVPVAHVVNGRQALWLDEPGDWSPYPAFLDPVAALGWPVVGVIPLGAAREVRGALYLTFAAGRQVPDHERQAVQTLAALCAAALERLVRAEEARAVADRLHLTRGRLDALDATGAFGIVRGGLDGALHANDRFLSMVGLGALPSDGLPWTRLTPPEWSDTDAQALGRARVTGEPTAYEKELWHADGRRVPVHVSLLRSRKEPFEATAVVLDLTEVKEKERRSRLLLEDRQRLSQTVQTALLPTLPDGLDGGPLPVVSAYQPGDERLALGGDFYDVVRRPDGRLGLLVGDVCGHGPLAAAVGAACRIAWRTGMLSGADLVVAVGLVDLVLRSEREEEGTFATIVSAIYDSRNGDLELLSAGHPPPLLLDLVAGHRTMVVDQGPLLGVVDRAEHVVNRMALHDGQALLLYTDGLIEGRARPGSSTRLGDDGLHELLGDLPAADLCHPQRIIDEANARHGAALPDDVALLVLVARPVDCLEVLAGVEAHSLTSSVPASAP